MVSVSPSTLMIVSARRAPLAVGQSQSMSKSAPAERIAVAVDLRDAQRATDDEAGGAGLAVARLRVGRSGGRLGVVAELRTDWRVGRDVQDEVELEEHRSSGRR